MKRYAIASILAAACASSALEAEPQLYSSGSDGLTYDDSPEGPLLYVAKLIENFFVEIIYLNRFDDGGFAQCAVASEETILDVKKVLDDIRAGNEHMAMIHGA